MNNKLVINKNLLRKESEFRTNACIVEYIRSTFSAIKSLFCKGFLFRLSNSEWETAIAFSNSDNNYHCLLIYDKEQGDGILIESEGAAYARYVQYIPNTKLLYENHMQTHLQELKFCCPLEINREPECWDDEYEGIPCYEALAYESEINRFIEDFTMLQEKERGLMNWYGKGNSVDEKVRSAFMSVEERDGELVGVITAKIYGQLTEEELEEFSLYCSGQLSDGAGESLEQRPIKTPDGDIYVSFWNSDDSWSLQTSDEMNEGQSEDMTEEPDMGMTM